MARKYLGGSGDALTVWVSSTTSFLSSRHKAGELGFGSFEQNGGIVEDLEQLLMSLTFRNSGISKLNSPDLRRCLHSPRLLWLRPGKSPLSYVQTPLNYYRECLGTSFSAMTSYEPCPSQVHQFKGRLPASTILAASSERFQPYTRATSSGVRELSCWAAQSLRLEQSSKAQVTVSLK